MWRHPTPAEDIAAIVAAAGGAEPGRELGGRPAPIAEAAAAPLSGPTRGTVVGIDGIIGVGATSGVVSDSVIRDSIRRPGAFHSPHQSSSRTVGQTPSIMYDFALTGLSMGAVRRHCPHWVARLSAACLPALRS